MTRRRAAVVALAGLATALAAWLTRTAEPVDDAAIALRYAARLAGGEGLTYTDGVDVLGASSGLHVLVLAALHALGVPLPAAAVGFGIAAAGVAGALVALLAWRMGGPVAVPVAVGLLLAGSFRTIASSGMESPMLAALGLGALLALLDGRRAVAGVLLGLMFVAKLDAAALALAVVVVLAGTERRVPWRLVAAAGATAAPWYLWIALTTGSPLPHSLTSKLAGRADNPGWDWDPTWALAGIVVLLPALLAAAWVVLRPRAGVPPADRQVQLALGGWFVLHLAAASLLPLGDAFGWYLTALVPPVAVLAGVAVGWAVEAPRRPGTLGIVALAGVALSLAVVGRDVVVSSDPALRPTDADRRWRSLQAAGRSVPDGALVATCFGWVAYEALDAEIADPCQITTGPPPEQVDLVVGVAGEVERPGFCERDRFDDVVVLEPC